MEFKGQVKAVLPATSGVSAKNREWKSQEFVVEEAGVQYPQSIVAQVFNDKIQIPAVGDFVTVKLNASANEWNGKYFQKLNAWAITIEAAAIGATSAPAPGYAPAVAPPPAADDLPF